MAKEAICALLAILEHFFEAFSPLDLFFALAPFRPASSASPCFPPSRLSSLFVLSGFRPPRFFIDSNLFHLPSVRSSQLHHGLVPTPSRRHPSVLSSSTLAPIVLLLSVARIVTPSTSPQAAMSAIRFCSSRATIFRPLRFPSLSLAALPSLSTLAPSCVCPCQPMPHVRPCRPFQPPSAPVSPAPCAPGPFLRTRASENHRGE